MIGKCSSCFMIVNGIPNTRTCIEPVRENIKVFRQKGLAEVPLITPKQDKDREDINTDVLIIGGGPAGLSAALTAARYGLETVVVDEQFKLGGQLIKQTHKFFGSKELFGGLRGFQIGEIFRKKIEKNKNVRIFLRTSAYGIFRGGWIGLAKSDMVYRIKPRAVIIATGASENFLAFPGNDLPGVMGAGGAQTLMNQYGILPGKEALIIGSGNVGLIVAYQLLQAGVKVKAVLEIMSHIGGWFVHAAKLRRYGVPILLRHTIKEVWGKEKVEGATIMKVDENFKEIPGSEKDIRCDLVLIATGLTPDTRLLAQARALIEWIPELGGFVPLRTKYLETSIPNMYIAGDSAGIEEATSAIIEGEIAALSIIAKLNGKRDEVLNKRNKLLHFLWDEYRASPLVYRAKIGKKKATVDEKKMEKLRKVYPPLVSFR